MDTNEKLSNEESSFNEQKINNINITDMSSNVSNASSVNESSDKTVEDLKEKEETEEVKESSAEEKEKSDDTKSTALVVVNSGGLVVARNMFKKSIKFSIKSFLISVSLTILNFFI